MTKIDIKSPKKISYPINVLLFNLMRLFSSRDKRIWLFGAREGHQYEDNSRYLFEYINKQKEGIHAIWLTRDKTIARLIQQKGFEAYTVNSKAGIRMALRAGVACYTNGLIDFGLFPLIGGAKIVALWHGMGFKKIYNGKYSGKALQTKQFMDKLFSWTYRDVTISTSRYANLWLSEMFTLKKKKIYVTGQPRNDAFKHLAKVEVLKNTSIDITKKMVLYMPTYRQKTLGIDAMRKVVTDLYQNKTLDSALNNMNSVFVAKLHPLTPHISLPNRDNFIILDYASVDNNQELLGAADILVTDYSSCFIDYALLEKPIVFYVPDEKDFVNNSEALDEKYFEIEGLCKATTPEDLVEKITNPSIDVAKFSNAIFEDESIKGTCYSENVYKVICKEIGLN